MPRLRLLVIACIFAPMAANAEGEQAVSAEAGWATFSTTGKKVGTMEPPALSPTIGGTLAVEYEREVSTDLSLRGELAGAVFSGGNQKAQTSTSYVGLADVGVLFRFDVLRYVPYAYGGIGGIGATGGPIDRGAAFVVVLGGGLDWLQSRTCSTGFDARLASFGGNITVFTVGLRGTVRWGFF
jgi:hypothetical protein